MKLLLLLLLLLLQRDDLLLHLHYHLYQHINLATYLVLLLLHLLGLHLLWLHLLWLHLLWMRLLIRYYHLWRGLSWHWNWWLLYCYLFLRLLFYLLVDRCAWFTLNRRDHLMRGVHLLWGLHHLHLLGMVGHHDWRSWVLRLLRGYHRVLGMRLHLLGVGLHMLRILLELLRLLVVLLLVHHLLHLLKVLGVIWGLAVLICWFCLVIF